MTHSIDRTIIADAIVRRFDDSTIERLSHDFGTADSLAWFYLDDLLPTDLARQIRDAFPNPEEMRRRRTLRESKYVAAQMNRFSPLAEEAVFAFQDARIVEIVSRITKLPRLYPDEKLYAGGISLMAKGDFLNPHLDNSHDHERARYRVLNLLYYCSPDWASENGGHLELWPKGVKGPPVTVESRFNRLAVMTTGTDSWHSVSRVTADDSARCCVSNYYFSPDPLGGQAYARVTKFRGRPEQPIRDILLQLDGAVRQLVRRLKPEGIAKTTHLYERSDANRR